MKGFWKDISWLEISIVAIVLLFFCWLTIPQFYLFKCRARQSEAKYNLAQIYASQKLYHDEFGQYASLEQLLKSERLKLNNTFYDFSFDELGENNFVARAEAKNLATLKEDVWSIDHTNKLTSIACGCTQS